MNTKDEVTLRAWGPSQCFVCGIASGLLGNGKKLSGQGRAKLTFQKETISGSMNIRFFLAVPKTQLLPSGSQLDSEAMKVSEAGGDNPETDTALPQ